MHGEDHVVVEGLEDIENWFKPFHVGHVGENSLGIVVHPDDELGLKDGLQLGI